MLPSVSRVVCTIQHMCSGLDLQYRYRADPAHQHLATADVGPTAVLLDHDLPVVSRLAQIR